MAIYNFGEAENNGSEVLFDSEQKTVYFVKKPTDNAPFSVRTAEGVTARRALRYALCKTLNPNSTQMKDILAQRWYNRLSDDEVLSIQLVQERLPVKEDFMIEESYEHEVEER